MKEPVNDEENGLKKGGENTPLKSNHNDYSNDYFTPLEVETLKVLQRHNTLTKIASAVGCKKQNTLRTLKNLIKKGGVEKLDGSYILSGRGHYLLRNKSNHSLYGAERMITPYRLIDELKQPVREHHIAFNVLLWSVPDGWVKWLNTCCGLSLPESSPYYPLALKRVVDRYALVEGWRNYTPLDIFLTNGFSMRVHTKGLVVHIPEVIADTPAETAQIAFKRLVAVLPKVERWFKLPPTSLYKNGRLNIKLVTAEYALIKNEFARAWVSSPRGRERFMVEGDNGELRLLVDMSPPFKFEFEAVHPVEGELDGCTAQDWFQDVIEKRALRPKVVKDRVEGLEHGVNRVGGLLSDELTPVLHEFSVQMEGHIGTAKGLNAGADALNAGADALTEAANASASLASTVGELVKELRPGGGLVVDVSKGWRGDSSG